MRVFITGGTGLIGRSLSKILVERGDTPVILSRNSDAARLKPSSRGCELVQGDPAVAGGWESAVDGCDAVINLAGHNLFAQRWSEAVKRKIRDSRVVGTEHVVEAMSRATTRPKILVQASAIGYYGATGDEELTEHGKPGDDFMAKVCIAWEDAAKPAESLGARLALIRTGVVLAKGDAALGVMTPIFKWLPGGAAPVGSGANKFLPGKGKQWMSWVHVDDIVGLFLMALNNAQARGPINGTAPHPVRNVEFSKALAKVVHRPFLPIGPPDAMLELVLGEVAQVVTKGQKVLPKKALELGYRFEFPDLAAALEDLLGKKAGKASRPEPAAV